MYNKEITINGVEYKIVVVDNICSYCKRHDDDECFCYKEFGVLKKNESEQEWGNEIDNNPVFIRLKEKLKYVCNTTFLGLIGLSGDTEYFDLFKDSLKPEIDTLEDFMKEIKKELEQ